MRFIIFSDSHGFDFKMRKAIEANLGAGLDGMIFLGDGLAGAKQTAADFGLTLYAVAGNCDAGVDVTKSETYERMLEFDGIKVLILHGHRNFVKNDLMYAETYARKKGADVLLYGHTHIRDDRYVNEGRGLYVFNPGSITLPKDDFMSFGLMELRDGQIMLSHGKI